MCVVYVQLFKFESVIDISMQLPLMTHQLKTYEGKFVKNVEELIASDFEGFYTFFLVKCSHLK